MLVFFVVYRGYVQPYFMPGSFVFIERLKEYGGGYWLGRVYDNFYEFCIERPVSMREGMEMLLLIKGVERNAHKFVDDFQLEPPEPPPEDDLKNRRL